MLCGFQYVKDACHKTLILPLPKTSRIPDPLPALSAVEGSAYLSAFPKALASWVILPVWVCGWLPAPLLENVKRVTLFRTSISRDVRTVLYAESRCE